MSVHQLRTEQIRRVMALIGPLLDAWDELPNDIKSDLDLDNFAGHMRALNRAMEGITW